MKEKMERMKQEMALLDYDAIYLKLQQIDALKISEEDVDRIQAFTLLKEVKALLTESRPVETRAVWLDDQALGNISSPSELRDLIKWLNELNVNLILPNVYFAGETIYDSKIVPQAPWYKLAFGNEDPFSIMIEEAHKYGMEVHPWVMVYGLQGNVEPFLDRISWLDRNKEGQFNDSANADYFFSPAHPDARDHIMNIISEVAEYDIDGIHLDNIRYKDGFGYGDYAVELYKSLYGLDPRDFSVTSAKNNHFKEFKAQFVASFVEHVRVEMLKKDPHIFVSAATAPRTWGKNSLGQDWHNWIDNRSLHFVLPMSYIETANEYKELIAYDIDRINGRTYAYPGMTLYSFTPEVMEEEWLVGQEAPITGQTLFSLLHIKPAYYTTLQKGLFREKATVTFREPEQASILYLDWLSTRLKTWGSYAGFLDIQKTDWLNSFAELSEMIKAAPMTPYNMRDLRAEDPIENAYWQQILSRIDTLIEKTAELKAPVRGRLLRDLSQIKSLITPLEYTTRPFEQVPIRY